MVEHTRRAFHIGDARNGGLEKGENLLGLAADRIAVVAVIVHVAFRAELGQAARDEFLVALRVCEAGFAMLEIIFEFVQHEMEVEVVFAAIHQLTHALAQCAERVRRSHGGKAH
ncbi:MAG: hypothetical protein ACRETL_08200, partial [Gammaproteobacteria bacterium]